MKTNELMGVELDWAVAKCEKPEWLGNQAEMYVLKAGFHPSTNWEQGGVIIEREGITLRCGLYGWDAELSEFSVLVDGETPLIAAMRCYAASKLGDEVDVPTFI